LPTPPIIYEYRSPKATLKKIESKTRDVQQESCM